MVREKCKSGESERSVIDAVVLTLQGELQLQVQFFCYEVCVLFPVF